MNDQHPTNHHAAWEPGRIDVLIGRVVDSEASSDDWSELERLADADPHLWGRLARAQRAHARLTEAVEDELLITELVDLPDPEPLHLSLGERLQRWSGWALAAALCLAWLLSQNVSNQNSVQNRAGMPGGFEPVVVTESTPDDAWNNYVETARLANSFVAELPPVLVSTTPLPGGNQEVFFVRRSLERATLTDMAQVRVSQDEQGRPVLISNPEPTFGGSGATDSDGRTVFPL